MRNRTLVAIGALAAAGVLANGPANAEGRYEYCRDQASRISGYDGEFPSRYRAGRKIARAAATGAAIGAIAGKKGKKGKAAKRGAAIGALVAAAKQGAERDRQRRRRAIYLEELDRCMY